METGCYPLSIYIRRSLIKYWIQLINCDPDKLVRVAYDAMLNTLVTNPSRVTWVSRVKDILQQTGFGYVWLNQAVDNPRQFILSFEQRCKDMHIQKCFTDMATGSRCRLYREVKSEYIIEPYLRYNTCRDLRINFTKVRLSSHRFMVERGRWLKPKVQYEDRLCTLCNEHDIQDEYHIMMKCAYFTAIRTKYIKKYYYVRPSMYKYLQLMNTNNSRERFRLMLLCKLITKEYNATL